MDVRSYNQHAWDRQVEQGNRWTVPVSPAVIAAARTGEWQIVLTPTRPVPRDWFPALAGLDVLCLASGGGQQAPILAAAGANVTVLDNSPRQLGQDRLPGGPIRSGLSSVRELLRAGRAAGLAGGVPRAAPRWRPAGRLL